MTPSMVVQDGIGFMVVRVTTRFTVVLVMIG
jgi:hypothetical protein